MVVLFHFLYLSAFIKMTLLALHIVGIGVVVGLTAFISYDIGKKDGLNATEIEKSKN